MKKVYLTSVVLVLSVLLIVSGCGNTKPSSAGKTGPVELNLATAGDTNMTELQNNSVVPEYQKLNPNVKFNVVNTGAGDGGSQKIYAKLKAQKDAGKKEWDVDIAIVHQSIMSEMMKNDLLEKYVPTSANKSYVTSADSKNSLGVNVDGHVIPLFHSQVALAYNPEKVKEAPKNFDELVAWIKANPKRFGYNGIKNGASGVAFTTAYTYWKTGDYKQLSEGPYDAKLEEKWPAVMKELKALPVTYTNGNDGTLDMLNRGEIDMGPVWVDMVLLWKSEGRMNPNVGIKLIDPGFPGQPMYVVIPKNAKNKEAAIKYADYLTSPEIQANVIVGKNTWYPGIDATAVLPKVSEDAKNKLFKGVTADDLAKRVLSFPIVEYFTNLKTAYEKN
jgi:ABC-type uncharacterized transport system YnjBCD substrate-binding protein